MVVDPKVQTTWQPYSYANDNPIIDTDPSGLQGSEFGPTNCASYYKTASARSSCLAKQEAAVKYSFNLAAAVAHFVGQHAGQIAEGAVVVVCTGASGGTAAAVCVGATLAAFSGATAQSILQHRFSVAGELVDAAMAIPGLQGAGLELMPEATYGVTMDEGANSANLAPVRMLRGVTGAGGQAYSWADKH